MNIFLLLITTKCFGPFNIKVLYHRFYNRLKFNLQNLNKNTFFNTFFPTKYFFDTYKSYSTNQHIDFIISYIFFKQNLNRFKYQRNALKLKPDCLDLQLATICYCGFCRIKCPTMLSF